MNEQFRTANVPAFPVGIHPGMTLHDWFAGQALMGLLSSGARYGHHVDRKDVVIEAASIADQMILARTRS